jgi:signal transduction histidine kinase
MQNLYRPPYSAILEQRAMTQYGWRWLEWVDTAIRDGQGRVSAIIGVGRDVTDRKRMEKDLERERIMLNSLMESMPAWMVLVDQDCHIRYCNQNFRDRFGFTTGTTCYQTLYGLERQCSGCSMDFRLNVAKSHEATLSDGRIYELSSLPFQDADGSPLLLEIGIDVTEKKALEAEAVRNHQLALLGQLAAGVAHEVNNPINGIINYAEMLKDLMAELGQASEVPDRIIKEGDRIADIVSSLLSFARVQTEDKQPVSVSEIIQETLSLIQGQLRKECIEVVQNIEANLPQVVANNQQIEQVLLNLFSNARHALQSKDPNGGNGKRIEISCRTADDGRMVRTRVLDNGVGMAGEVLQNIYTPFFSTKAAGQGTGLGMSIIFGIIKDHGGQIEIDSRQGEYTLIEFDLPTVQAKREKKV